MDRLMSVFFVIVCGSSCYFIVRSRLYFIPPLTFTWLKELKKVPCGIMDTYYVIISFCFSDYSIGYTHTYCH